MSLADGLLDLLRLTRILHTRRGKYERSEKLPMKARLMSLPDNLVMAAKSSWRSRERVLAVFA